MAAVTLPTHYRNVFAELGYAQAEIDARIENTFHTIFYGDEAHRFYHPTGPGLAYIEDTGNHDVRTEGMSYGMMLCVQTDHKAEFDALWSWVMHYMYMQDGPNAGYFAWSCQTDGTPNANGPAPDGEEYFAMALFFAAGRWGCGSGIYDYAAMARRILHSCLHKGEKPGTGRPMWDPRTTLSNLSPSVILPIRPTICPTSIHCSRCGPTRRIARSGPRLPGLAAHFSIKRATRSRVSAPSIPSTTVRPTTARTVISATTCITAMPTAPSPTWRWTTPGSGPTRGRPKTPSGCKIFLRDAVRPHKRHLGD